MVVRFFVKKGDKEKHVITIWEGCCPAYLKGQIVYLEDHRIRGEELLLTPFKVIDVTHYAGYGPGSHNADMHVDVIVEKKQ
jgi:hypothetical protein